MYKQLDYEDHKNTKRVEQSSYIEVRHNKSGRDLLIQENNSLKRSLFMLTEKIEEEQQKISSKAGQNLNSNYIKQVLAGQYKSVDLQNAYKMIERLQKTAHLYENKQSYQITLAKILELENKIKLKSDEAQKFKTQLKYVRKSVRDKQKHIEDLEQNKAVIPNDKQQKQLITRLKLKLKKVIADNQSLKKKQLNKHRKLVTIEQKILSKQKQDIDPSVSKDQELLAQIQQIKQKNVAAELRIQKQNLYINKLTIKLSGHQYPAKRSLVPQYRQESINTSISEIQNKQRKSQSSKKKIQKKNQEEEKIQEEIYAYDSPPKYYNDKNVASQKNIIASPKKQNKKDKDRQKMKEYRSVQEIKEPKQKFDAYLVDNIPKGKLPNRLLRRF